MTFHYTARGILISDGHVLLVRMISDDKTFLPGGHIDHAEPAPMALERELMEEACLSVKVGRFIGAVENQWDAKGTINVESCMLFELNCSSLSRSDPIQSNEAHLEYLWVPIQDLEMHQLYPKTLRDLVCQLDASTLTSAFWASEPLM